MDLTELNNEFDILFENLATAGSKGLDSYEKSVCYTYVQEQLVKQLAFQDPNAVAQLFTVDTQAIVSPGTYKTSGTSPAIQDAIAIVGYFASDANKDIPAEIVPQKVIDSLLLAPYQYPPKNLVYVVVGEDTNEVFLPLNFNGTTFTTRYVMYPPPIILTDITPDTIDGISTPSNPSITEAYHRTLVNSAVQYAIQIYVGQQEKEVPSGSTGNQ